MAKKQRKTFRIGLLGESPNDTRAMEALLKPRYGHQVEFFVLLRNITGDMLEDAKTFRNLRKEYEWEKPNLIISIRDLDGLETNGLKWRQRQSYFRKVAKVVEQKSLSLLHIYELETLICADIMAFNKYYACACPQPENPTTIVEPKEWLMARAEPGKPHYLEGHSPGLLAKADYDLLLARCPYFADFDRELRQRLIPAA